MTGIAVLGAGMIGAAHASGYRSHIPRVPGLGATLHTVCDTNEAAAKKLATRWDFDKVAGDWREVMDDPEIGIVSVCLPNFLHKEVTLAALAAGKHILCEKPLALNADDARELWKAANSASVVSGTVFNYRRIPAVADIKKHVANGDLGDPIQITVHYQCDYAADPMLPHSWRYEFDKAGPGALLDLGAHGVDMARHIFGDVSEVTGAISTIAIKERFKPLAATAGHGHVELSDERGTVDNDDVMSALLRFVNGAQGFFTTSRVAVGTGNRIQVEVFGTKGSARYSTEQPSHYDLAILDGSGPAPWQRMLNRPASAGIADMVPVSFDLLFAGYGEVFGLMIYEFLSAIAGGRDFTNGSMEDGYRAAQILDAIQEASVTNAPVAVDWND
jgi:predicted dehydrogenase